MVFARICCFLLLKRKQFGHFQHIQFRLLVDVLGLTQNIFRICLMSWKTLPLPAKVHTFIYDTTFSFERFDVVEMVLAGFVVRRVKVTVNYNTLLLLISLIVCFKIYGSNK